MAFLLYKVDDGHNLPIEYLPAGTITPKVGMALTQSNGKLAIATGATKPAYVSLYEAGATLSADTIIPVARVDHSQVYETTLSASGTSLKLGNKVTLHASSGMQVTATTDSGVAEVIEFPDGSQASGAKVRVRF